MTFTESCAFVMPFGKHKGSTLARIGANDEGLRYLDWCLTLDLYPETKLAIQTYLDFPDNSRRLDAILED